MNDDKLRHKDLSKSPKYCLIYYILNENIYPGLGVAAQVICIDNGEGNSSHVSLTCTNQVKPPIKRQSRHIVGNLRSEFLDNSLGIAKVPSKTVWIPIVQYILWVVVNIWKIIWHHHSTV